MESRGDAYIGGHWESTGNDRRIEVVNPSTEDVLGSVARATAADVDRAVRAARAAFPAWSALPLSDRLALSARVGCALYAEVDRIATMITTEVGAPINFSRSVQLGLSLMDFEAIRKVAPTFPFERDIGGSLVVKEPIGVVGCITPWNYPLHQVTAKILPALAVGCTVIVKPSELAPFNVLALTELFEDAGLPPGVVNVVTGYGHEAGEALVAHPEVDMISFTGSTRAGRRVSAVAAETVKRVALELGGKSAAVILDDADPDQVVTHAVARCFVNAGQTCSALTRLLVPRAQLAGYAELAAVAADAQRVGDPTAEETTMGPLVSADQRDRVRAHVRDALAGGACAVTGGVGPPLSGSGYFFAPTVLTRVTADMRVAQEEVFGPVLSLIAYDDEEEAIAIANGTVYGLSGAVWSADPQRAERVARRLRAGQVMVNRSTYNHLAPFGGYKQSGNGRELGQFGLESFLEIKAILR